MHIVVRCAFDLGLEGKEICISENGIQFSRGYRGRASHTSPASGQEQWATLVQECGMNVGVLVPVPIRQSKLCIAGEILANPFKIDHVGSMSIKEIVCAVLAKGEPRSRTMYSCLILPAA